MDQKPNSTEQWRILHDGAGFLSIPSRSLVVLTGEDRALFLNNLCTNDLRQCLAEHGCEVFLTNVQGKTLAHGFALVRDDSIWLVSATDVAGAIIQHLDRYIIREDVSLCDVTMDFGQFLLSGLDWNSRIAELGQLDEMWRHQEMEFAGCRVLIVRTGWSVAPNRMLVFPEGMRSQVADQLSQSGGTMCEEQWFDALRIEAGFPEFGRDITETNLPQEIDRNDQAISFKKGCYLGQETVARIDALGHVNWLLRKIEAAADTPLDEGMEIVDDGTIVARVKSVAVDPRSGKRIGLALVRSAKATGGNQIALGDHTVTVTG